MTQLIDCIVDLLSRHGGRPTAGDIARLLLDKGSWDFGGADPVAGVESALAAERASSDPRVVRFFDAYALRGPRRRFQSEDQAAQKRITAAGSPSGSGSGDDDEAPDPARRGSPVRHELTGEAPRLLLDLLQGPRLIDHLDGRTVAALVRNDYATVQNQWVSPTPAARSVMRQHLLSLGRSSGGRAAALFPAIAELVISIPPESEIELRSGSVAAADLLIALYDAAVATGRRPPVDPATQRAG